VKKPKRANQDIQHPDNKPFMNAFFRELARLDHERKSKKDYPSTKRG
jgi:hypothetical protein